MDEIAAPIDDLLAIMASGRHVAEKIDWDVLRYLGVFVVKGAFRIETIDSYAQRYFEDLREAKLRRTPFHLTEIKLPEEHPLRQITKEKGLIDVSEGFFDGNVGACYIRVVKKDVDDAKPVFLHQDTGYQVGGFERYSLFIPLTACDYDNGGLVLFPGTHHFGYLGDVGEIIDILPGNYPRLRTSVVPGDILIMHSAIWHQSPPNSTLRDRVYLEINIQQLNEPTASIPVCGTRDTKWKMNLTPDQIFRNSRAQRIRQMHQEIEALRANANPANIQSS